MLSTASAQVCVPLGHSSLYLFMIFINDIDKGIANRLLKFADDTKLVGTVSSDLDIEQLHSDLEQLYDWSIDRQMLFNVNKCKVSAFWV